MSDGEIPMCNKPGCPQVAGGVICVWIPFTHNAQATRDNSFQVITGLPTCKFHFDVVCASRELLTEDFRKSVVRTLIANYGKRAPRPDWARVFNDLLAFDHNDVRAWLAARQQFRNAMRH